MLLCRRVRPMTIKGPTARASEVDSIGMQITSILVPFPGAAIVYSADCCLKRLHITFKDRFPISFGAVVKIITLASQSNESKYVQLT